MHPIDRGNAALSAGWSVINFNKASRWLTTRASSAAGGGSTERTVMHWALRQTVCHMPQSHLADCSTVK